MMPFAPPLLYLKYSSILCHEPSVIAGSLTLPVSQLQLPHSGATRRWYGPPFGPYMIGIRFPHEPPSRKKILLTKLECPCHGLLAFHMTPTKPSLNDEGRARYIVAGALPPG